MHDTVIRVDSRPGWYQRIMRSIDHPDVDDRMRTIAASAIAQQNAPHVVTVTAQWKGKTRTVVAQRGVIFL